MTRTTSILELIKKINIGKVSKLMKEVDKINNEFIFANASEKDKEYAENLSLNQCIRHSLLIEGLNSNLEDYEKKMKIAAMQMENMRLEDLTLEKILKIHKMIIPNGGEVRNHFVGIRHPGTGELVEKMLSPKGLHERVEELIEEIEYDASEEHPLIKAIDMKKKFVHIHPFGDGNGRMSRLLFNWFIRRNGYRTWVTFPNDEIIEYCEAIASTNYEEFYKYTLKCIKRSFEFQRLK